MCHPSLSVTLLPVTTGCSAMVGCMGTAYSPFSIASVPPSPPRGPLLSVTARPLPVLAPATYSSLLALPPNPNGLSCCNCAGRHPFAFCSQPTMLQVIASGEYKIDYNSFASAASPVAVTAAVSTKMTGNIPSPSSNTSLSPQLLPPPVSLPTPPPAPNSC
ncbi:unnamed protein product [Gongylonema pulchrum]|uniref:Uncharacterized protein n=1 Tax=Gongylonema pulchrum TaxID=637853 RepID=A0A3P7NVV5_9BILA|nr:unnamed protein product [Gongylonema pulchrum]